MEIRAVAGHRIRTVRNLVGQLIATWYSANDAAIDAGIPPGVELENDFGVYRRIADTASLGEAQLLAQQMRSELSEVGIQEFCRRHGLDADFAHRRSLRRAIRDKLRA